MSLIEEVTVYADVRDPQLLQHITATATQLCSSAMIHTAEDDPLAFLHLWEKERADVWRHVRHTVPILRRLECFITDTLDVHSGAVAYALYVREMPVLSLSPTADGAEDADDIAAVLYDTLATLDTPDAAAAVRAFFAFPKTQGVVVGVEGRQGPRVGQQARALREHLRHCWPHAKVVLLGAAGRDCTGCGTMEEAERGEYAALMEELLHKESFRDLRRADPQLHGALCALQRFRHLPLLRYRLQRGVDIILCRPYSAVLEELERGKGESQDSVARVMDSLLNFEHHWLDLPQPAVVLLLREAAEQTEALTNEENGRKDWLQVTLQVKADEEELDAGVRDAVMPFFMKKHAKHEIQTFSHGGFVIKGMAKINATYSSGYYLAPDTDYRKLEDEQSRQRKRQRQDSDAIGGKGGAIRQTFAIPFNIICLHCNQRIARGTHGYVNRRPTPDKYMGIRIWELEFRCIFCKGHIYLTTDYETAKLTGGYHCSRNCKRGQGDFYGTNQINESVRAQQAAEEAEKGTVDALERENEVMRQVQERERLVEELVEAKSATEEEQIRDELLQAIRARQKEAVTREKIGANGESERDGDNEDEAEYQRFEALMERWRDQSGPSPPLSSLLQQTRGQQTKIREEEDMDTVAASIAEKYSCPSGEMTRNVFMTDDSDDEDGETDTTTTAVPLVLRSKGSKKTSLEEKTQKQHGRQQQKQQQQQRRRGDGSALASLLDD